MEPPSHGMASTTAGEVCYVPLSCFICFTSVSAYVANKDIY